MLESNNESYLKMWSDFFNQNEIKVLRCKKNGDKYILLWIQLLLEGVLQKETGELMLKKNIPYTKEMVADVFNTDSHTVVSAFRLFESFEMINQSIYGTYSISKRFLKDILNV